MEDELDPLVFGTDGWRDVIADRFTFANLRRAAQAYAEHLSGAAGPVLVGYDTRFLGRRFALEVAAVLQASGVEALVSADYLPTPALSFAVRRLGASGGVMLTASHNPPEYSGFKLKGDYGGTATDEIYRSVADRVPDRGVPAPSAAERAAVGQFDVKTEYYRALAGLVDVAALQRADLSLLHDPMGGAGSGWLKGFADFSGALRVEETRGRPDPLFHGVNPEPIPSNLASTIALMGGDTGRAAGGRGDPSRDSGGRGDSERAGGGGAGAGFAFAVATDGDGDRLGVVLPGGTYFNSHQIFAVLLDHLAGGAAAGVPMAGAAPSVVKTFTVSRIIERLAAARGLALRETPVGFKYIVEAMLDGSRALIGGEESGGIGVAKHLPERDGLANALLLLEAVVAAGEPLGEIFARLERETGWRHAYDRLDLTLPVDGTKERLLARLEDPPAEFAGWAVASVEDLDGVKLNLSRDGVPAAWLLFRASGTEPVLRLYCEAPDSGSVRGILEAAEAFVRTA